MTCLSQAHEATEAISMSGAEKDKTICITITLFRVRKVRTNTLAATTGLPCTARSIDGSGKPPAYMTPNRNDRGDQPPPYMTPGRDDAQVPATQHSEARERTGATGKKSPAAVGKLLHKKARKRGAIAGATRLPSTRSFVGVKCRTAVIENAEYRLPCLNSSVSSS